jgi:uncharacterized membrane protein YbhN (UPF0104 family)
MGGLTRLALSLRRLAESTWLRAIISVGLMAIVLSQIDLGNAATTLSAGNWALFAAAVAVLFGSFLLAAIRWDLFLETAGMQHRRPGTIAAYLIGAFTNNFLPSQVGGDLTRAWLVGARGTRVRAATTVVVDRTSALACLIVASWLVYAFDPTPVPDTLVLTLGVTSAALLAAAATAALAVRGAGGMHNRLRSVSGDALSTARACLRVDVLARALALGVVFQGLVLLALWLAAQVISLDTPFSVLAVTLPAVLILSTLPISIGGFGVRESSFVLLLGRAGVSATDATLLSLVSAAAFAFASLPGALALVGRGSSWGATKSQDEEQKGREGDRHADSQHPASHQLHRLSRAPRASERPNTPDASNGRT